MSTGLPLSQRERQVVEDLGLLVESNGLPRILGRTVALLLLAPRPLALEEVAATLKVSRASVSVNTRLAIVAGLVEPWAEPGDRRRFYRLSPQAFVNRARVVERNLTRLEEIAGRGLEAVDPSNAAAIDRLRQAHTFAGRMVGAIRGLEHELQGSVDDPRESA